MSLIVNGLKALAIYPTYQGGTMLSDALVKNPEVNSAFIAKRTRLLAKIEQAKLDGDLAEVDELEAQIVEAIPTLKELFGKQDGDTGHIHLPAITIGTEDTNIEARTIEITDGSDINIPEHTGTLDISTLDALIASHLMIAVSKGSKLVLNGYQELQYSAKGVARNWSSADFKFGELHQSEWDHAMSRLSEFLSSEEGESVTVSYGHEMLDDPDLHKECTIYLGFQGGFRATIRFKVKDCTRIQHENADSVVKRVMLTAPAITDADRAVEA